MHKHRSKREELRRRVITYTMFPLAVVLLAFILLLTVMGYRFNVEKQTVVQGGLMQFESSPSGARVMVDNERLSRRTNTRYDATAGSHTVTMTKDQYHPWQKTVTVEPGKILWLNYARLIPLKLKREVIATRAEVAQTIHAYRKDKIALHSTPASPEFEIVDISSDEPRTEMLTVPADIQEKLEGYTYTMVAFDNDAKQLLVKATKDTAVRWLLFDVDEKKFLRELSAPNNATITEVLLDKKDDNKVYIVAQRVLYRDDIREPNPQKIIERVAEVSHSNEGVISYVTLPDATSKQRSVGYYTPGASSARKVRTFYGDGTRALHLRTAEYARAQYIAIQYGETLEISTIHLHPSDSQHGLDIENIATLALTKGSDSLSFSPSARFVVAQKTTSLTTYDLELNKMNTLTLQGEEAGVAVPHWIDAYMLWSDRGGKLQLYEFDGQNSHEIGLVKTGQTVVLTKNEKYLYFVQRVGDEDSLVRVALKL